MNFGWEVPEVAISCMITSVPGRNCHDNRKAAREQRRENLLISAAAT